MDPLPAAKVLTTVWYLLITPIPTGTSPAPSFFKTFEIETYEGPTQADCQQFAAQRGQIELEKKYPPATNPAIIGSMNCFSRQVMR